MKRFVTLDFMRGMSIFMMLILHVILRFLDEDGLLANMDNIPLINFIALVVLPFLGGLAGLFLLISAIGNQVSMQKYLERNQDPNGLILRQIVGGIVLLVFAMLSEGLIGYHGTLGASLQYMGDPEKTAQYWAVLATSRYNHFETIHTIAWCLIINGVVQGLLAQKGRWKDHRFMIKAYVIMIVVVLVITQPVWYLLNTYLGGYPWTKYSVPGMTSTFPIAEPSFLIYDPWVMIQATFLAPLAAPLEPILPYLAVSFIGSIVGILITLPADKRPKRFIKTLLKIGLIMFAVGAVGIALNMVNIAMNVSINEFASAWTNISNHRAWFPDNTRTFADYVIPLAWLFQFIGLTGFSLMLTMIMFRTVECRGIAEQFAKKTTFIRRFGIVAFTNYNNQFIFYIVGNLVIWIQHNFQTNLNFNSYKLDWGLTGLIILITLAIFHVINLAWEKIGYIGSIEWCIGRIASVLIPARKKARPEEEAASSGSAEARDKRLRYGMLDVEGTFYNAQWVNLVQADEAYHSAKSDSKVLSRLALFTLIPVFMPAALFLLPAVRTARKVEGRNPWSTKAYTICLVCSIVTIALIVLLSVLTLDML